MSKQDLAKSLTALIDETLAEIEALKKSDRFSAQEIELGDEKGNGHIEKAEDKESEEEKEEEDKEKTEKSEKDEDEDEEDEDTVEKAELYFKKAEECYKKAMAKAEKVGINVEKSEKEDKPSFKEMMEAKKEEEKKEEMEKSLLNSKIDALAKAVAELKAVPVPARGVNFKTVQPLTKTAPEAEVLSKSVVMDRLFDLKKSGINVDTEDMIKVETGMTDAKVIATKYGIK